MSSFKDKNPSAMTPAYIGRKNPSSVKEETMSYRFAVSLEPVLTLDKTGSSDAKACLREIIQAGEVSLATLDEIVQGRMDQPLRVHVVGHHEEHGFIWGGIEVKDHDLSNHELAFIQAMAGDGDALTSMISWGRLCYYFRKEFGYVLDLRINVAAGRVTIKRVGKAMARGASVAA